MEKEKLLKIILSVIFFIILLILIIYITQNFIKLDEKEITTSTKVITTTLKEAPSSITSKLDTNINLTVINLLMEDNIKEVDLLQNEVNKFKYIYTYIYLNNINNEITFELVNNYSNKLFNSELYENNIKEYLKNNLYILNLPKEFKYKINKVNIKNDILYININDNLIEATYKEENDELIIQTFKIIK